MHVEYVHAGSWAWSNNWVKTKRLRDIAFSLWARESADWHGKKSNGIKWNEFWRGSYAIWDNEWNDWEVWGNGFRN